MINLNNLNRPLFVDRKNEYSRDSHQQTNDALHLCQRPFQKQRCSRPDSTRAPNQAYSSFKSELSIQRSQLSVSTESLNFES